MAYQTPLDFDFDEFEFESTLPEVASAKGTDFFKQMVSEKNFF